MRELALCFLGPWQATFAAESPPDFKYDKVRALLAYLAVEADRPHRREALLGMLWPEMPEAAARNNLRQVLATLRKALGERPGEPPFLLASRATVQLNPEASWRLDVAAYMALIESCQQHPHRRAESCQTCARRLEEAVALYRGPFLAEFFLPDSAAFEEWAVVKREQLSQLLLRALDQLAAYYERRGRYEAAVGYARRQLEVEPWREAAHRQVMRLLALNGERNAALAQYEQCCRVLRDELGVEPEPETVAVYEQIRDSALDSPVPLGRLALPTARRHTLPPSLTPFVGRDRELAEVARLLEEPACRLLTLTGPGGIGKTRLALQAATEQLDAYADGVYFVPLVALPSAALLADHIAAQLGVEIGTEEAELQLLDWLEDKELLLLIDNAEPLLDDPQGHLTRLLAGILRRAPDVAMLVTSRERLRLQGEWLFAVEGLAQGDGDTVQDGDDALQLFVQSAQRSNTQFRLTPDNRPSAVRICRLVGGHPLAIELAAAWTATLSCAEIVAELEQDLTFLQTNLRDLPERHRSLTAVFEQSYRRLAPAEQAAFRRLSLFPGGFRRQAAERVAGATPEMLADLSGRSLLYRTLSGRLSFHEALRLFAAGKLQAAGEVNETRRRFVDSFLALAAEAEAGLFSPEQETWLARLDEELPNIRAALEWSCEQAPESAGQLASRIWRFWQMRGHVYEGRGWLQRILDADSGEALSRRTRARLLEASSVLAWLQADYEQSEEQGQESLALYRQMGDTTGMASLTSHLGVLDLHRGDYEAAVQQLETSLELRRQLGDRRGLVICLNNLGAAAGRHGDYERSRIYYEEALVLSRELGNPSYIATLLANLGDVAEVQGEHRRAHELFAESLALRRQMGEKMGIAYSLNRLGHNALHQGDIRAAYALQRESLELLCELGDKEHIVACLEGIAAIASVDEPDERAPRLWGATAALREALGVPAPPSKQAEHAPFMARGCEALGQPAWEEQQARGRALSLAEAIACGLALCERWETPR